MRSIISRVLIGLAYWRSLVDGIRLTPVSGSIRAGVVGCVLANEIDGRPNAMDRKGRWKDRQTQFIAWRHRSDSIRLRLGCRERAEWDARCWELGDSRDAN
jgi:hypothetical protein